MEPVALLATIALLGAVVLLVSRPLLGGARDAEGREAERIADLLAARDAKYREIRELELDHRTGKVAEEDFRAQDRVLRAEAMVILRELDRYDPGQD
ncbi:hypothetical protein [Paraconexibacter sp.]|uniref:hypothetical protein n=1 Tax=Paraconexibacter sp. TaxID=2949640 RepID=UPI00356887D5